MILIIFSVCVMTLTASTCFAAWIVQTVEEDEDDFTKTEILVSEPKKVGDGMSAYIVYKVTTRVSMSKLVCAEKLIYHELFRCIVVEYV